MDVLLPLRTRSYELKFDIPANAVIERLNRAKVHAGSNLVVTVQDNFFKIIDERRTVASNYKTRRDKVDAQGEIQDCENGSVVHYSISANDTQTTVKIIGCGMFLALGIVLGIGDLAHQVSPGQIFRHLFGLPLAVLTLYTVTAINVDASAQTIHTFLLNLQFEE